MIMLEREMPFEKSADKIFFMEKMRKKERVTARAVYFDSEKGNIVCNLSDTENAILPMSEVVMKDLKILSGKPGGQIHYPEIANIIGRKIGVIITYYDEKNSTFVISRRDSMLNAFEELRSTLYTYCEIRSMSIKNLFVETACGIPGIVNIKDATTCKIRKLADSFSVGEIIKCAILNINEEEKALNLSHKMAVEASNIELHENDIVYGKVRDEFIDGNDGNDSIGQKSYLFEIFPYHQSGILNCFFENENYLYGDSLVCSIAKINYGVRYKLRVIKRL